MRGADCATGSRGHRARYRLAAGALRKVANAVMVGGCVYFGRLQAPTTRWRDRNRAKSQVTKCKNAVTYRHGVCIQAPQLTASSDDSVTKTSDKKLRIKPERVHGNTVDE
jgi:hypothetical protein